MRQILYRSVASEALESGDVFKIVQASAANNNAAELSGFLLYSSGCFLQLLEGPEDAVSRLIAVVQNDERHRDFSVLFDEPIQARSFPQWRMRRIATNDSAAALAEISEHSAVPLQQRISGAVIDFLRPGVGSAVSR